MAAGYCVYGPQTTLVLTVGDGVAMFTLDREQGSFVLMTQETCAFRKTPKEFAINMSNMRHWDARSNATSTNAWPATGPRGKDFNMRWIASMVATCIASDPWRHLHVPLGQARTLTSPASCA